MKKLLLKSSWVLLACAFPLAGCAVRVTPYGVQAAAVAPVAEVTVDAPPPAPLVDTVVVAPGPDFVWIPGAWAWHDRWVWESGRWDRPPHPGMHWAPHQYAYRNGRRVFVRGGWR